MDVVCNACDGMVTVKPGYALSPCGDDIVVCADAPVDICSMIQKCSKKQPRDCQPAQPGGLDPCSNTTEQWILKIHYDEKNVPRCRPSEEYRQRCVLLEVRMRRFRRVWLPEFVLHFKLLWRKGKQ